MREKVRKREKVVSAGFGVFTFDAVGTLIGTKYIFQEGFLWELTKTKMDVGTYLFAIKTGWEKHPEKIREDSLQKRCASIGTGVSAKVFW